MVVQRQREQRAAQISYEQENGGSDPISPEFWDDDQNYSFNEEMAFKARLKRSDPGAGPSNYNQFQTPPRRSSFPNTIQEGEEEEDWAAEAARAEEAEREAEEVELARQVEESYRHQQQSYPHQDQVNGTDTSMAMDDIEMDWDVDMDF